MLSLNNHISNFGRPLARFLVQTKDRTRSSQHAISITTPSSQPKHTLLSFGLAATHCRQFASFGFQNFSWPNASTTRTATATVTAPAMTCAVTGTSVALLMAAKRVFVSIPSRSRNLSTPTAPTASSSTSSSSASSSKPPPGKVKVNTSRQQWSYDENVKLLELMKAETKLCHMALYFPKRSKCSIRARRDKLQIRLESFGATFSDLDQKKTMKTTMSKIQSRQSWSREQDELLQSLYKQHGRNWKLIKTLVFEGGKDYHQKGLFPRRLAIECKGRIESLQLEFNRGAWSAEELERFWASIREVEADYRSKGESIWSGSEDRMMTFDENHEIIRSGGRGRRLTSGFWASVQDKVQTRSQSQCRETFYRLSTGKCTETGRGREKKLWTIEELEALRDLKVGRSTGWESGDNGDKSDGEKTSNRILTDEQREATRKFLLQTRKSSSIEKKVQYIRDYAKAHSLSNIGYIDKMIENRRRWGYSEQQMKERGLLIAEKMDRFIAKENN